MCLVCSMFASSRQRAAGKSSSVSQITSYSSQSPGRCQLSVLTLNTKQWQQPYCHAGLSTPASSAAHVQPAATASLQPQLLLSNLMQMGDAALQSELKVGWYAIVSLTIHIAMPFLA